VKVAGSGLRYSDRNSASGCASPAAQGSYWTSPQRQTSTARPSILLRSILACGGRRPSRSSHEGLTHTTTPVDSATRREYVEQNGHVGGSPPGPGRILSHFGTSSIAGSCPILVAALSMSRAASCRACGLTASANLSIELSAARVEELLPPRIRPGCPATTIRRLASSRRIIWCASMSALMQAVFPGVFDSGTDRLPTLGSASLSTMRTPKVGSPPSAWSEFTSMSSNTRN
jgi:hypothetical protein